MSIFYQTQTQRTKGSFWIVDGIDCKELKLDCRWRTSPAGHSIKAVEEARTHQEKQSGDRESRREQEQYHSNGIKGL